LPVLELELTAMVPKSIRRLLGRLRARERMLELSRRVTRAVLCCAALLVFACLVDFVVDRRHETPRPLRVGLLAVQVTAWVAAAGMVALTLFRRRSDEELALHIEEKVPALGHRLISAVQLNRAGAKVEGMSPELIAAVTRQAEEQAGEVRVQQVCPGRPFRVAWLTVTGVLAGFALFTFLEPYLATALLTRVFLEDSDIPRNVELHAINGEVWPTGEEGVLRFVVTGEVPPRSAVGEVRLYFQEGPPVRLEMRHDEDFVWSARVPALDVPFTYGAWIGDARLRRPCLMRYEPRPVVQSLQATALLPVALLGERPTGEPYEEPQRAGDIDFRLPGSRARVRVTSQVPIAVGFVSIRGEKPRRVRLATVKEQATAEFDLLPGDRSYAVHLFNNYAFENVDPPRRSLRKLPLEPPEVALLPEQFWRPGDSGPPEDREVEGIPLLLGERFALAYACSARYGVSHAQIRYRVLPKGSGADEESGKLDRDSFLPLPLGPARDGKHPASERAREEFSTKPPASKDALPHTEGGGRYDFSSAGISDGKGGLRDLKEGDRIQFYVEVFGRADPDETPGRSAVREKEVVDVKAYLSWLQRKEDLKERTRDLEEQQRTARPGAIGQ
jgi:hypothetical protein